MNRILIENFDEELHGVPSFQHCFCSPGQRCIERGKIVWDTSNGTYIHLRFNHCVMRDEPIKRCDCIIFFQFSNDETHIFAFVVEVKDRWYSLTEVKEKIETCIERLTSEINIARSRTVVIPVLYAERHISNARRTFSNYPVRIRGKPQAIKYLKHGDEITNAVAAIFHPSRDS